MTGHDRLSFVAQQVRLGADVDDLHAGTRWIEDCLVKGFGKPAFGLDGKVAVSQWLAFGLGGSIGVAHRHVDLSAADAVSAGGPAIATSAIAASRTLTPFLGNAEARMFLTPWSNNVVFKGFAGINYDSKVPGISSPAFDSAFPAPGTNVRPANIKTEAETSFYAGGGVTVRF